MSGSDSQSAAQWVDISQVALQVCRNPRSPLHGLKHWRGVAVAGLILLASEPEASPAVVWAFAMLHDCARLSDDDDPEHGKRASRLIDELGFTMPGNELQLLKRACGQHNAGRRTRDPTIGVCWDADRLNLWRLGIQPDRRLLSTATGQDEETIETMRTLHAHPPSLLRLCEAYMVRTRVWRDPRAADDYPKPKRPHQRPLKSQLTLDRDGLAIVYHGTASSAAALIDRRGIVARPHEYLHGQGVVFATPDFGKAAVYAFNRANWNDRLEAGRPRDRVGCTVFEIRIDPADLRIDPEGHSGLYVPRAITREEIRHSWRATLDEVEQLQQQLRSVDDFGPKFTRAARRVFGCARRD